MHSESINCIRHYKRASLCLVDDVLVHVLYTRYISLLDHAVFPPAKGAGIGLLTKVDVVQVDSVYANDVKGHVDIAYFNAEVASLYLVNCQEQDYEDGIVVEGSLLL